MARNEPTSRRDLDGYGAPEIEWSRVREVRDAPLPQAPGTGGPGRHTAWLTTIDGDGAPHVAAVGIVAVDGAWYFSSGPGTRKSRNLGRDPRCAVSIATEPFDLVVEGVAQRVVEPAELEAVAAAFVAEGWPARVEGEALVADYNAQTAGPPPWYVHRVEPSRLYALGTTGPGGATRFEF